MRDNTQILDEIRARLPTSVVVGRRVQLKKRGREWVGLSPFTQEKTPSFTVNDVKGFYHCFSTSKHGDIFSFVMETEGLSFPEAIEKLAGEAGVALPKFEQRAEQKQVYDQNQRLLAACEAACVYFEGVLMRPEAGAARAYMEKRGLLGKAQKEFRLGFATGERFALRDALTNQGFSKEELMLSGLLIHGDDIPVPYDRFRDRIIFPIQDAKGRVIAFGGRAMAADAQAKYLNSPETPLFHKGHTVFNIHRARKAAHEAGQLLIAEGYVDVIALAMHGFMYAVAPLGTALTEEQLALIWRMTPVPTLCFDGDKAGLKAAYRAVDTAMPHLEPGKSLNFAFLPQGQDPDDLLKTGGAQAMHNVLAAQEPLIQVLWRRETSAHTHDTPEARALLERDIHKLAQRIKNPDVARHYGAELNKNLEALLGTAKQAEQDKRPWARGQGGGYQKDRFNKAPAVYRPSVAQHVIAHNNALAVEAGFILGVVAFPQLLDEHLDDVLNIPISDPSVEKLRRQLVAIICAQPDIANEQLLIALDGAGATGHLQHARTLVHREQTFTNPETNAQKAMLAWHNNLKRHLKYQQLAADLKQAEADFVASEREEDWQRQIALKNELDALMALEVE